MELTKEMWDDLKNKQAEHINIQEFRMSEVPKEGYIRMSDGFYIHEDDAYSYVCCKRRHTSERHGLKLKFRRL